MHAEHLTSRQSTADGVDTLYHAAYAQTYHSTHGALLEARHVFLEATGVAKHLARRRATTVLEVGFGTGLNFLMTAHKASQAGTLLHYVTLENNVLPADVLAQLNHGVQLGAPALHDALLTWRRTLPPCVPSGWYHHIFEDTFLTLVAGDATTAEIPILNYDAVYLDAFSPDANPELWTEPFLARLFAVMNPGAVLATYSAKGSVRRALAAVGFHVEKQPGPPGKREMLVAIR